MKSKKIRAAANGQQCTLNTPWCNYNPETTVFCHLNEQFAGKGMGIKAVDIGFMACSDCHDIYDRRRQPKDQDYEDDEYFYVLRAVVRTWLILISMGVVKIG